MKLSILIPAHNEEETLGTTVEGIMDTVEGAGIDHEIIVVNDNSTDGTAAVLARLSREYPRVRCVDNPGPRGFGAAVQTSLEHYAGDAVVIVMADCSDHPEDIIKYYRGFEAGYDCMFGSRFMKESRVSNYPFHKLILNRLANQFVKLLFSIEYNDVTNAFKGYRRAVIDGLRPLQSRHFNLTVELPLKAIVRGYRYSIVPVSWTGRKRGIAKFRIKEMGSCYLSVILALLTEKLISRKRKERPGEKGQAADGRQLIAGGGKVVKRTPTAKE